LGRWRDKFRTLAWRITRDIYDKKHQEYNDKLQLLNIELEEHTKADFDYQTTIATVFSVARRAKEIFESSETAGKRVFLNYLFQNPVVNKEKLEFTMRSPFDLVLDWTDSPFRGAYVDVIGTGIMRYQLQ